MLNFLIINNNDGTTTVTGTNGTKTKKITIDQDFLECVQDVDEIDPIAFIKETIRLQLNLGDKNEDKCRN